MTTRELLNYNRGDIENYIRARAKTAYVGDAVLCRVLGNHNMYVDHFNYDMAPWLMLDGLWEIWIAMAIGRAIQPGWTCIDAGAWCGFYSIMMADLVGSTGKVIAYEPNEKHANLCRRSFKANGFSWAELRYAALSNELGAAKFLTTDGGGSRLESEGDKVVPTEMVDSLAIDKVDLIKMDIEGGEYKAWTGIQKTISKNKNIIVVMEINTERYDDPAGFYADINRVFPVIRSITTDGVTKVTNVDEIMSINGEQMIWLQN